MNAGRAVLSVRQWLGAPRRSKQRELFRFDKDSGIGVELMRWGKEGAIANTVWNTPVRKAELANNDGLTLEDWLAWFSNPRYDRTNPMAIIHFTPFRYCK